LRSKQVGWKADSVAKSRDRKMVVRSSIEKVISRPRERPTGRDLRGMESELGK
jgi:hypothetical protein